VKPSVVPRHVGRWFWGALAGAFLTVLFGVFGPHPGSVWGVERQLKARVEAALAQTPARHASVEMEGQTARLIGSVPTEAVRAAAIEAALTAAGPGGMWRGGVMKVIGEDLVVGAPTSVPGWRATLRDGRVTLSGQAANTRIKRRLYARAREAFGAAQIVDSVRLAPGAPSDAHWVRTAEGAIMQLSKLQEGEARLSRTHLVVLGDGDARAVNEIRAYYRVHPPNPYRARLDVEVTGEGLGIADLGELDLARGAISTCQAAFDRMMARNIIQFEDGSAEIDRSSLRLLSQLASIALRCDRHRIEIAGHTDDVGARDANVSLSQRRAEAVADKLASQGVASDRLRAVGYGPDRPRASNATAVGQAANRRIEFKVSD
jgi:OOP family OmpA-OmpF porin